MRRVNLLLAGAAALVMTMTTVHAARADWHLDNVDYFDDDGDWVEFWSDDEGHRLIFVIEDGETIHYIAVGFDNPNPVEGSGSEEDWDHLTDLLKKHGAEIERRTKLAGTPLGHVLLRNGNLVDPYHNPSDVGYEDAGGLGGGGGGFTPGNGSPTDQLKRQMKKGSKSKGDSDDGDDLKSTDVGLFDDDMPGPPDIVNPNPVSQLKRNNNGWERRGGGGESGGGSGGGGGGGAAR
ncbi:hypothetical protein [Dongia mobilis]|uniref:hypothetical protein n=1 Tax=Dongia sp. TaxID=1977262 RepID=UPI0026ED20A0